ncbi:MAG TPA: AgmX/PglI C-terminal domain-containing protein [Myxococcales bacterium]|nr:AgmX/PglI C-terminal domain-containing protein [Myxococcales bacterium]
MVVHHRGLFSSAFVLFAVLIAGAALAADEPSQPAGLRAPDGTERVAIGETIRSRLEPLRGCYNRRLERVSSLSGKLMLRFDIERDGKVAHATAEGINDSALVECVIDQVQRWQFLKPIAGATLRVVYPVVFKPA